MNYMKNQELLKLKHLSTQIGHFIRYWGFRKIHGEIWAVVYLAESPMSGIEIGTLLNVSKALISPAIKELEEEGLISQIKSENSKTKRYKAEEDVTKIIRRVLSRREKPMINKIQKCYQELSHQAAENTVLNSDRLQKMGLMIQMAQTGLDAFFAADNLWS